ncbi:MAG: cyclopropane fatty acyl phospholipid synthase [Steroidobacteraceae bacterium]
MSAKARETVIRLLGDCDVQVDGPRPTDIHVRDPRFYTRVLAEGSIGVGESYMDGWWDAEDLDGFITQVLRRDVDQRLRGWHEVMGFAHAKLTNLQSRARAFQVGERHYDIGNDLYSRMLDSRMIYSCAYWVDAATLEEAQVAKLNLTLDKLRLQPGQTVLDVGCGWGGALKHAVERYGVSGVGVTVSKEQAELARGRVAGLPVEIRLTDYRDLNQQFDHAYSIGMFEHVGPKNYRTYLEVVRRCLKPGGRFLLHTIGALRYSRNDIDPWIGRYIFPNAVIARQKDITDALDGLFWIEGWQRIGPHYDPTLIAWRRNFEAAWPELSQTRDERFYRMWRYYLSVCAAGFRAGVTDVWQVLLTRA